MTAPAQLSLATQLTRFVVTGALSAVVDFGLMVTIMAFGVHYSLAKALSFIAGTTTAYLINRRWTFQSTGSKRKFAAVVGLYGLTFVLQWGIFTIGFPWLVAQGLAVPVLAGRPDLQITWAQLLGFVIAQGVATAVNFVVQRLLIFRP